MTLAAWCGCEAIHSGGQTGADQGALRAAVELGLRPGGWVPRGYRTETNDVTVRAWLVSLGLRETTSRDYAPRTRLNVEETDGTLIFGTLTSVGTGLTIRRAEAAGKPLFKVMWRNGELWPHLVRGSGDTRGDLYAWAAIHEIRVLNVAGNRESRQPGIERAVRSFLCAELPYVGEEHP